MYKTVLRKITQNCVSLSTESQRNIHTTFISEQVCCLLRGRFLLCKQEAAPVVKSSFEMKVFFSVSRNRRLQKDFILGKLLFWLYSNVQGVREQVWKCSTSTQSSTAPFLMWPSLKILSCRRCIQGSKSLGHHRVCDAHPVAFFLRFLHFFYDHWLILISVVYNKLGVR